MRLLLLSCEVLARQVYYVAAFSPHVIDIQLVDKGLHSEPDVLRADLQGQLDALEEKEYDAVLLGYGLCSNATAHLVCDHTKMVLPRAHDCITLYLGSKEWYGEEFRTHPGTYWYTPDYMERGGKRDDRVSLGAGSDDEEMAEVYAEYVEKYGRDNADYLMEVMGAWKQHYDRAAYIETQEIDLPDYTDKVQEIAEGRGWDFQRLAGSLILLRDLLEGRWDEERFLIVPPRRSIVPTYDRDVVGHAEVSGIR